MERGVIYPEDVFETFVILGRVGRSHSNSMHDGEVVDFYSETEHIKRI